MTDRTQLTLEVCLAILAIVLVILVLLVNNPRPPSEARDTKKILDSIEGMRQQNSAEHGALQSDLKTTKSWVLRILNRFGFLQGRE